MARLFLAQARLDNWASDDRIRVDGDVMRLGDDPRTIKLKPAVRFMKVAGGGEDPNQLVGKVKLVTELAKLGGEHYMESVLLGDVAYDVQSGFIGEPQGA